ncbi:MAG: hypothetical protein ACI4DO_01915 [Roseburia sp.]
MKKTISVIAIFLFLILMLVNPITTVKSAAYGLLLWYEHIMPALLPFAILADLLIHSSACYSLSLVLHPLLRFLFKCSRQGSFPLAAGFLFGFPMGSRICSQMVSAGQLSREEASILFLICNNISPIFIISFVLHDTLGMDALLPATLLCLYMPAIILGRILMRHHTFPEYKNTASGLKINFSILDAGIMNSFEMICKLGGYIILFSILTGLIEIYCPDSLWRLFLTAPLEITNGVALLGSSTLPVRVKYSAILSLTAFGGICGIAQTYSMVHTAGLPMKRYLVMHLLLAGISGLCGYMIYPVATFIFL